MPQKSPQNQQNPATEAEKKPAARRKRGRGADPAQTKSELIEAAVQSLVDEGYRGTTARSIAARADCNQAAIYYHFGGIDELLIAALEVSSQRRLARYESSLAHDQTLVELIESIEELYVEDRDSGHLSLLTELVGGITATPELREGIERSTAPWLVFVEERISEAAKSVSFGAMLPSRDIADLVFSLVIGVELRNKVDGNFERSDRLFRLGRLAAALAESGRSRFVTPLRRRLPIPVLAALLVVSCASLPEDGTATADLPSSTTTTSVEAAADPTTSAVATTSITTTKAPVTTDVATTTTAPVPPVEPCHLPLAAFTNVGLGVPRFDGLSPSTGTVDVAVLFADFDDVPAVLSPEEVFDIIDPIAADYFDEVSYGTLSIELRPHFEWLRLSQPSADYGQRLRDTVRHRSFLEEAVQLADDDVDFSEAEIVLLMANPDAEAIPYGPVFVSPDVGGAINVDGAQIAAGITSGFDLNYWGGMWLAHELGHTMSLPDLYAYNPVGDLHSHVGTIGLMGDIEAQGAGYFAFERWMLGWIEDDQVYCHLDGDAEVLISPLELPGGVKAVMVPVSETKAVVVESRRRLGVDSAMVDEGAVVYTVDSGIQSGFGPIEVSPGVDAGFRKEDAPLTTGETYTFGSVMIEVLQSNDDGDRIAVSVSGT